MYYVYVLRTAHGTLYTGITPHPQRRLKSHCQRTKSAARYTKSHPVVALEGLWSCEGRRHAAQMEAAVKSLPKKKKELLLCEPHLLSRLLPRLEKEDYLHHPLATLDLYLGTQGLQSLPIFFTKKDKIFKKG